MHGFDGIRRLRGDATLAKFEIPRGFRRARRMRHAVPCRASRQEEVRVEELLPAGFGPRPGSGTVSAACHRLHSFPLQFPSWALQSALEQPAAVMSTPADFPLGKDFCELNSLGERQVRV